MKEKCPHLKCSRWNVDGICYSGRRSRCLRVRLERGDAFPIADENLFDCDETAWATEVVRLWRKAGWPTLVCGVAPEQLRLARGILGLAANHERIASTRLLAEQIVDDLMCRHDGNRRQAIRLMLVTDAATDPHGAGWGRESLIDRIEKHLKANTGGQGRDVCPPRRTA